MEHDLSVIERYLCHILKFASQTSPIKSEKVAVGCVSE